MDVMISREASVFNFRKLKGAKFMRNAFDLHTNHS
jgi:hypothetical protein